MSQRNSLDLLSRKEGMCLLEQSMGFVWQAALRAVAVLGVADRLVEGKKSGLASLFTSTGSMTIVVLTATFFMPVWPLCHP
ncbi:hypothetical protein [Enterobacter vonholyi]|uniref:hypothetical protein n=1 Tax=Enterobacter vonholyi TaxID=2797505 RepID=UPI00398ACC84